MITINKLSSSCIAAIGVFLIVQVYSGGGYIECPPTHRLLAGRRFLCGARRLGDLNAGRRLVLLVAPRLVWFPRRVLNATCRLCRRRPRVDARWFSHFSRRLFLLNADRHPVWSRTFPQRISGRRHATDARQLLLLVDRRYFPQGWRRLPVAARWRLLWCYTGRRWHSIGAWLFSLLGRRQLFPLNRRRTVAGWLLSLARRTFLSRGCRTFLSRGWRTFLTRGQRTFLTCGRRTLHIARRTFPTNRRRTLHVARWTFPTRGWGTLHGARRTLSDKRGRFDRCSGRLPRPLFISRR